MPEVVDAGRPLHVVVAEVQSRVARGVRTITVSGEDAAAVASRLVRLLRGEVAIVVRLGPVKSAAAAAAVARDAVALAGIAGGRASFEVGTSRDLALLLDAVREEVRHATRTRGAGAAHFGGDLFAAQLRLPWPGAVDVRVAARPVRLAA